MWIDFEENRIPALKNPSMIVAVSTSMPQYRALYSQARELAEYLLGKMDFRKIGTVRASAFPPEVLVRHDGLSTLPECSFYICRGKKDLLLFAGDSSPADEQYEFAQFVLKVAKDLETKELYSVGARWAETPVPAEAEPVTTGFSTDPTGVANLRNHGVRILGEEPAPFFASMVVAMAKDVGIRGYKLSVDHGEPTPHVRSVTKLLEILCEMASFEVDLGELKAKFAPASPGRQASNSTIYH
ncbi:MAG TPA: PAC2 family protein [Nitrososphaerales archaeon]|nr:PAC2 family protein [Nitrososphaerales archaeon]